MAETRTKIDGFLKVPDIPGPSTRDGHEEEIEVYGIEYTMVAPFDPNSLSRRGRVAMGMVEIIKDYDMSSPLLKMALFKNTLLDEVKFSARRTIEGETSDYLVVTMKEASVMKYEMRPSPEEPDVIQDRIGFAYKTIVFSYDAGDEMEMDVSIGK